MVIKLPRYLIHQLNETGMKTIIEAKRTELNKVQILINRITKKPARKFQGLNAESKKMLLSTLDSLSEKKSELMSEIIALS